MIHKYYVSLGVVFALFLAQNFKTKVLTAHENLLLEYLLKLCSSSETHCEIIGSYLQQHQKHHVFRTLF